MAYRMGVEDDTCYWQMSRAKKVHSKAPLQPHCNQGKMVLRSIYTFKERLPLETGQISTISKHIVPLDKPGKSHKPL